jgi:tRNA (uracil-5-)-methyltransferase
MTVLAVSRVSNKNNKNNIRRRRPLSISPVWVFCAATTAMLLCAGRLAQAWTATTVGRHGSLVTRALATTAVARTSTTKQQQHFQQQRYFRVPQSRLCSVPTAASASTSTIDSDSDSNDVVKVPAKFIPYPFAYRQEIEIRIESLTHRGWGVGRLPVEDAAPLEQSDNDNNNNNVSTGSNENNNNDDDIDVDEATSFTNNGNTNDKLWVIMVPNVIIGELVKVRVFRNYASYSEADLVEVLEYDGNQSRVEPLCPLAQDCGGCQLQHMHIHAQREWKTDFVQQGLAQYNLTTTAVQEEGTDADVVLVQPCLGTDEIYGYRSKLTPHYQAPAKRKRGTQEKASSKSPIAMIDAIGFQKQTNRQILDVPACPIATPAINRRYQELRHELLLAPPKGKKGATLLLRQANVDLDDVKDPEPVTVNHQTYLTTRVRGLEFSYLAGNFFQNNLYVLPLMVDHVLQHAATVAGNMDTTDTDSSSSRTMTTHLVDCYCGSGLFAISAAAAHHDTLQAIVGIEINDRAVLEATNNAIKNNVSTKCEFVAATAEGIFDQIQDFPRDTTCTILDPPRKGCSQDFLEQLFQFGPAKIVYMSCDPSTQARDAQDMVAAGYTITSVQPFDLFPQTRHIECLMVLERVRNN